MKIAKSVNRLGTEAVYSIFAKTKKLEKQGKKIIDLSLGQSDFKSPKHAVDATIQALKDVLFGNKLSYNFNDLNFFLSILYAPLQIHTCV